MARATKASNPMKRSERWFSVPDALRALPLLSAQAIAFLFLKSTPAGAFLLLGFLSLLFYLKLTSRKKSAKVGSCIADSAFFGLLLPALSVLLGGHGRSIPWWVFVVSASLFTSLIAYSSRIARFSGKPKKEGMFLFVFVTHPLVLAYGALFIMRKLSAGVFVALSLAGLTLIMCFFLLFKKKLNNRRDISLALCWAVSLASLAVVGNVAG